MGDDEAVSVTSSLQGGGGFVRLQTRAAAREMMMGHCRRVHDRRLQPRENSSQAEPAESERGRAVRHSTAQCSDKKVR